MALGPPELRYKHLGNRFAEGSFLRYVYFKLVIGRDHLIRNVGLQHKATFSNPSPAVHTCMPSILGNNFIIVLPAQEKDADLVLATNDTAVNDELTPEGQEDDGDWEQVGPRNKSMVTRMVRC